MKGIMKSLPILIYCNTGNRARRASELLKKMGYEHVYYIADTYKTLL
jgi:rhodanese-related sulfurtransferase